jgi:hypothetical protein
LVGKTFQWSFPVEGLDCGHIHDVGDVFERKQPGVFGGATGVKDM